MFRWLRRAPAYAVNGATVALGVALVQTSLQFATGAAFAQAASTGAVLASLPHLSGRAGPTFRRALMGGLLGTLALVFIVALDEQPLARGLAIALIAFTALMAMAWGPRAGPITFSVVLAMIFALARPLDARLPSLAGATLAGVTLYSLWALFTNHLLERRFRQLAVATAVRAAAKLLRARAQYLTESHPEDASASSAHFSQVSEEVGLADALHTARDSVFPARAAAGGARDVALLASLAELREVVLTSRLDLDLLGEHSAARFVRARLALGLRLAASALEEAERALLDGPAARPLSAEPFAHLPDLMESASYFGDEERARLLPLVAARLHYLVGEVEAIRGLLRGGEPRVSLSPSPLDDVVADEDTWPLTTLTAQCSRNSPVFRHALRSALAFGTVYFVAYALPWTTRPHWMLLSVAVTLRGTLDQTLSRRNLRVLGTALGCVTVAVLAPIAAEPLLRLVFFAAVGAAHAFVNVRYLLTAASATVMALLQARFAAPTTTFTVVERLLDTVLGASFAWAFSYVLPSWERRALPIALERAFQALAGYAGQALQFKPGGYAQQRLLRQEAYDALEVVSAALRRSYYEPKRVRPPERELLRVLDHGQRLMAHLSSVRLLLANRRARLPASETHAALAASRSVLDRLLNVQGSALARDANAAPSLDLPGAPPELEPLPWLLRRLDACARDAAAASIAADTALSEMTRRAAQRGEARSALRGDGR